MQYGCMRHLWWHLVFPDLCNYIVVCGTYNFLQKLAITQTFKMADLDVFIVFIYDIIFCIVWVEVYTQKVNNRYEIEDKKCCMNTLDFPGSVQYSHTYGTLRLSSILHIWLYCTDTAMSV